MLYESAVWTRPQSVEFPSVWRRFKGLREISGTVPSFWIQDIPENELENVVNFMVGGFCKEERLCKNLGVVNDPESVESSRKAARLVLLDNVGLACYMENTDPNGEPILTAANCTYIKKKSEEEMDITGSKLQHIFATLNVVMHEKNAFEFLETDFLLSALGLYVLPQFRGQGLGLELLNARMPAESARWPRPETIPYPNVWKRFKGRKEINGVIPSFWIQDVPEDEFQNVVNCMVERFCTEEPLTKYSGMLKDPKSVEDMRNLWIYMLHNRVGLACYKENSDPRGKPIFAGVNCMHIKKKHEPEYKFSGTTVLQIFGTLVAAANKTDLYEFFGTDAFLSSLGLYVLPEFRGQGIGLEMLLARQEMCKALKVEAAITLFTSTVSQVLAEKAGYNVLNEISYADLRDVYKFDYPGAEEKHKSVKYMYVLYK